jgi:general secretion pathway protein K
MRRTSHRAVLHAPRGAALLLAMVILTVVATVAAGMVWQQSRAVAVEAAMRSRMQSAWILGGALDWARLILREDQRDGDKRAREGKPAYDGLDEPWATPLAEARLSSFLAADRDNNAEGGPEAFLSGSIADAQSKWNLRNLFDPAYKVLPAELAGLRRLVDLAGVPSDTAERIAAGLQAAYREPADEGGARARPLAPQTFADLVWIGIEPATIAKLDAWVTLLPVRTPVNVNTASREAIVAAVEGLDLATVERLIQQRQRDPFQSLEQVKAQLPPSLQLDPQRISVQTRYFEVTGRLRLEERALEERSLVERRDNGVFVVRRERLSLAEPR